MYRMPKEKLPDFLDYLERKGELYIPFQEGGVSFFKRYERGDRPHIDAGNTDYSAKQLFFPHSEVMFRYGRAGDVEKISPPKKKIIFGLRPCDLHAIAVTDTFFSDPPADPYYAAKRESATLIALECTTPGKNCFCDSLGKRDPVGHDLLVFSSGKFLYAKEETKKGLALIKKSRLFEKSPEKQKPRRLPCKKRASPVPAPKVQWGKWGKACFACGACTSVCPTCTCFDVEDEKQLSGKTERFRTWSSCFTKDFTTVAGGHCFRPSRTEMLKQFVSHKFPYFKKQFGTTMCVGCGRCITACTAKIDISKIISGK